MTVFFLILDFFLISLSLYPSLYFHFLIEVFDFDDDKKGHARNTPVITPLSP